MSSPVVTKEFWWKFRDGVTQEVAKARQAIQQGADEVREEGSKVANTGEDWKKMGTDAKEAAQETSQSLDSMKEKLLSYQHAATDASKNIREQFNESKQVLNGIPKQKTVSIKAQIDSNKLKSFSRKIRDVPKIKETAITIKDRFSNGLRNFNNQLKESQNSSLKLKDVLMGTFLGNAVLNGIYGISNGLKGLIATGYQYTRQQQTMIASWNTLTGSASKGQEMVDMTNKLAISAQNSTEMVNDLNQKFYAVTNSAGKTKELSQSVLTLQDAFNASDASIENFSTQWAQMVGNGKASAQDMLSIQNVFPKFRQELLAYEREATHNKNLTMQQMNDMMSQGKISSKAMNDVLIGMGHKYQDATKNFTNTLDGMGRIIKTTAPRLLGAMVEPFTKAQNPIYKAVSNWVSDRGTQKKFNELGKTMSNGISKIMTAFAGKGNSTRGIENSLNRSFDSITNKVKTAADTIAKNANNIKQVFSIINSISSIAFKSVGAAIMDVANIFGIFGSKSEKARSPLSAIAGLLRGIADNKAAIQALGVVMLSVFTVNKYMAFTKWLTELKKTMLFTETVSVLKTLKTGFTSLASVGIRALGGLISGTKELTVANAALDIALSPITWTVIAVVALGVAFYEAYKHCKTFRDIVNKVGKAIKDVFTGNANWEKNFVKGFQSLEKDFGKIGRSIGKEASKVGKSIKNTFTGKAGWEKDLKKNFSNMQKEYQKYSRNQTHLQEKEQKEQQKRWDNFRSGLIKKTRSTWNDISKHTQNGVENVRKSMESRSKSIEKAWNNTWSTIGRFIQNAWKDIRRDSSNGMNGVHGAISNGLGTINRIWSAGWNTFSNFFKGIWNGIKQAAANGMNGVINVINAGIGAINKVWSFFTGHGTGLKELGKVHFAQGGTVHRHLSVINDGDGPDWKELVQTPDGNLFMSQERNWTGFLPEGTRVYSGAETRQIMNAVGVSHYATGGIVGEGIDWAKGSLENVGSWLGDKFSALEDFLADPLKATKGLLEKATSGLYKGLGNFADVAHGAMDKLTQPIADWFKKGLEKLEAQFESGGASPDLIRAAAAKMHVAISGADISHIMNVIKHESGGDARAINNWDSNAKAGHPSKGILQFIDGTFRKYAVAGHTNIYSPFDQLLAMFNDTTWRSDLTLGGWGPTGGRRFATGGEVFGLTNAIIGDNPEHHEFVLNPYAVSAEPLLDRAFEATAQAQPASSSTGNGNSKLDQMIDLLGKVLVAIESQETDIYLDGEKITDNSNKRNAKNWSLRKGILS